MVPKARVVFAVSPDDHKDIDRNNESCTISKSHGSAAKLA